MTAFSSSLDKMIRDYQVLPSNKTLNNILDVRYEPNTDGNSIFFIETGGIVDKVIHLTSRQSCSVESAGNHQLHRSSKKLQWTIFDSTLFYFVALVNPSSKVFVLFPDEVGFFKKTQLPVITALLSYKNVQLAYFKVRDLAKNSPLELWFTKDKSLRSDHMNERESNILRILVLWKFTGTFLDLDVIVKKPMSSIGSNFACIGKDGIINSAILNLDSRLGRFIAEASFDRLVNGSSRNDTGNAVLSTVLEKICNTSNPTEMTRENCDGFKVLPAEDCYAISSQNWGMLLHENYAQQVEEATKDSFAIHLWNSLSHNKTLSTHSRSPYIRIAEKFCPKVLDASGDTFWYK